MNNSGALFSRTNWFSVRDDRIEATLGEINAIESERLLNTSFETLCAYFEDKNAIEIPVLDRSEVVIDSHEVVRDVNDYGRNISITTTEIEVTVPFSGPSDAFGVRPSTSLQSPPHALVTANSLVFMIDAHERDQRQVKLEIERTLDEIESQLSNLSDDISEFKKHIAVVVRKRIEQRRTKLLADRDLVSSLGYKLKQRPGMSQTYAPPAVRRKVTPRLLPSNSVAPFRPEPALTVDDYEHILTVIHDMALVMERSPSAFQKLDEESLRFLFLVPLNGHYEGSSSGETFNYGGKTDILIRVDGKNIFVAECKFWAGPQQLTDTIDQLLNYTCWRDTKTAIILFNKNKNFSKVLEAIPAAVSKHPNFLRATGQTRETEFRYSFSHRDDPGRALTLTVLAFDVPRA